MLSFGLKFFPVYASDQVDLASDLNPYFTIDTAKKFSKLISIHPKLPYIYTVK